MPDGYSRTLPRAAEGLESPYDVDARFRTKRGTAWTGYMVHVSETCDQEGAPHLITHVDTTSASPHEATRVDAIHAALAAKGLPPAKHLVDAAYVSAALLVHSRQAHGVDLVGPPRPMPMWRRAVDGFGPEHFRLDWARRRATCPAGKVSMSWGAYAMPAVHDGLAPRPYLKARFAKRDCAPCAPRARCISAGDHGRRLSFLPPAQQAALDAARARQATDEGRELHNVRAGVEGMLSQAVRAFRPAPGPLPRPAQDAGAARGHRGGAQPGARDHPPVAVRLRGRHPAGPRDASFRQGRPPQRRDATVAQTREFPASHARSRAAIRGKRRSAHAEAAPTGRPPAAPAGAPPWAS